MTARPCFQARPRPAQSSLAASPSESGLLHWVLEVWLVVQRCSGGRALQLSPSPLPRPRRVYRSPHIHFLPRLLFCFLERSHKHYHGHYIHILPTWTSRQHSRRRVLSPLHDNSRYNVDGIRSYLLPTHYQLFNHPLSDSQLHLHHHGVVVECPPSRPPPCFANVPGSCRRPTPVRHARHLKHAGPDRRCRPHTQGRHTQCREPLQHVDW